MHKILRDILAFLSSRRDFAPVDTTSDPWGYPISLDFTLDQEELYYAPKDAEGIPVRRYRSVGLQYNPTRVAAYGLAHWNRFRQTGEEDSGQQFTKIADWFARVDNGVWAYHFDWNDLKAPWVSCMAQGEGISVLARAYILTGNQRYLDLARMAVTPLERLISDGGVQSTLDTGDVFLEEYPSESLAHVLNGCLYAVIGILELRRLLEIPALDNLIKVVHTTLERNIHRWDVGYWTAYDLVNEKGVGPRNIATATYHSLHISQIIFVSRALNSIPLQKIATCWLADFENPVFRIRALLGKIRYRLYDLPQR